MSTPTNSETGAKGGPPPHLAEANDDMRDPNNEIFFAAVETTRMPMIVTDPNVPDNPIVFANPAFLNMTGYTKEELLGRNCRLLQGRDTDPDAIAEIRLAVEQRRETAVEVINYKKNGSAFWNALFVSPVFDRDGKLIYFFGSQLDVSRRRDAEDALRQAQKMEAVGQLTGGVAHDFNNLLTVIQGFSDLLMNQLDRAGGVSGLDVDKAKRSLKAVMQAADRGASLTQQLLAFARKQKLKGRVIDLNETVKTLLPLIERTAGGQILIQTRYCEGNCNARIDPVQAELALMNILINARDAMTDGGTITVEVDRKEVVPDDANFSDLLPGEYVVLAVTDDGAGIPPDLLARVTEPFFTTKDQGKGTGLGLSMVYGFARQSSGAIRIVSDEGRGTTVRLFFPAVNDAAEPRAASTPVPSHRRQGSETILVVEDQPDVGELAEAILKEFGYTVLRAGNGEEAVRLLESGTAIDLLFSDLIMPGGMNGVMLAREARRQRPRIKVLLTTGYAEASIERVDARGSEFDLISKPYKRSDLADRVRQALDGPNGVA